MKSIAEITRSRDAAKSREKRLCRLLCGKASKL
jgi:hypothetical protein